jgi:hypothetical protein
MERVDSEALRHSSFVIRPASAASKTCQKEPI